MAVLARVCVGILPKKQNPLIIDMMAWKKRRCTKLGIYRLDLFIMPPLGKIIIITHFPKLYFK